MYSYITKSQLQKIKDAAILGVSNFHMVLKEYTGIEARPYTAYLYCDDCGNLVGGDKSTAESLLETAYIEVRDDGT